MSNSFDPGKARRRALMVNGFALLDGSKLKDCKLKRRPSLGLRRYIRDVRLVSILY